MGGGCAADCARAPLVSVPMDACGCWTIVVSALRGWCASAVGMRSDNAAAPAGPARVDPGARPAPSASPAPVPHGALRRARPAAQRQYLRSSAFRRPRPQGPLRLTPEAPAQVALGAVFDVRLRQQFHQPAQEPSDAQVEAIRRLAVEALEREGEYEARNPIHDASCDTTPRNATAWRGDSELYPAAMRCPITCEPFRDPVVAADGHSYERSAIVEWLQRRETSPATGCRLPHPLVMPNHTLRAAVDEYGAAGEARASTPPAPPPTPTPTAAADAA